MFNETGFIVVEKNFIAHTIFGSSAEVIFPINYVMECHRHFPGKIILAHTHPGGFIGLSNEDKTTLKALTIAFYPYEIFMDVVCLSEDSWVTHNRYRYLIEPKEIWKQSGRKERQMDIYTQHLGCMPWTYDILRLSYERDKI